MARFDFSEHSTGTIGATLFTPAADVLFQMGLLCALGRDGEVDLVAAHMYFNLADRDGVEDAAYHRQEVASQMTKADLGKALRAAREWIAIH
jgi:hypothetical protein